MSDDLHWLSATDLIAGLKAGRFSSRELTESLLQRIDGLNPKLNALVTICPERALRMADAADKRLAQKDAPPLCGVPIIQKDIFCTRGLVTTCGSRMLAEWVPPYSATVVEKLERAGTVLLGKANMDEFAMGSSNETSWFGPVRNPWNTDCVPGGSSGGSAAAVAAGMAPLATATDTGGSIRQPAAFCGLTGIKPTYGRVSRLGMIAFASSLDQGGVLARSAQDAALMLEAMSGFDPNDSTCLDAPVPDWSSALNGDIGTMKLGIPKQYLEQTGGEVKEVFERNLQSLSACGAELLEVDLPHADLGLACYYIIAPAECSSNLARYDGVRYGYRCENPSDLEDMYRRSRTEGFGKEVRRRIVVGTHVLSSGYYDAYYVRALRARRLVRQDFLAAFDRVDALVCPTTANPCFAFGAKGDDPVAMYREDLFTLGVNLAGLPAISVPAGFGGGRLPLGLQIIGRPMDEQCILNAAHRFQQETDWHLQRPENVA